MDFETKLLKLSRELQDKNYSPGKSICFAIKHPKPREIFAGSFRDRIVHHLLTGHLEPIFEPAFISHSYACRENKGIHSATNNLKKAIDKIAKNQTRSAYYAQIDIRNFFCSIDKNILYNILKSKIRKKYTQGSVKDLCWLAKKIIFHDPTRNFHLKGDLSLLNKIPARKSLFYTPKNKGLPIGNLTSQFFANVYLNELDQYIKRKLKVKYYFRYADDMLFLSTNIKKLRSIKERVNTFLKKELKLELHPKKTKFGSVYSGINFIGYIVKPNYTLIRKRIVNSLKTKLHFFNKGLLLISNNQTQKTLPLHSPPSQKELKQILAVINSYFGLFRKADSYRLRKNLYQKHFKNLKKYLKPQEEYKYFKIKNDD